MDQWIRFRGIPAFLFLNAALHGQVIPITQARALPEGTAVTVRGRVTNGPELGRIRFLQDGTAGLAAYPAAGSAPGFEAAVTAGDSVEVSGILIDYHGLLEISPVTAFQVVATGLPLPAAVAVGIDGLSEALEGQLVRLACSTLADGQGLFAGGGSYGVTDQQGQDVPVYIGYDHPLQGTPLPQGPVDLTGILSAYDGFQLLPRAEADLAPADCFYFSQPLQQSDIQTGGFQLSWQTNFPATAVLLFGPDPAMGTTVSLPVPATEHTHFLGGLQPGAIYWVQATAVYNGDTLHSGVIPLATQSLSSGTIKVYFNHPIDAGAAQGLQPDGQTFEAVLEETIARIDAAEQTVDVAMYNNNRADLTQALYQAHARGVRVRYIAAQATANTALQGPPPFPVAYGNSIDLMHNKFLVIDAALTDRAWVMSGSLNWTTGNMTGDFNNTLFIQDQSLARAYELEFNEMWGSAGAWPDAVQARFGPFKRDDTPHRFRIAGRAVESWFSPSDRVTRRLVEAIASAGHEAQFALFSFTRDEPGTALRDAHSGGVQVRGMIENINDPGVEYGFLLSQNVPVAAHSLPGLLHHKYLVVDAGAPASDPLVVTGSHNWSYTAEASNDENTLIIHDAALATLFKAEFERRWSEQNPAATVAPARPAWRIFPNPAVDFLTLEGPGGALPEGLVRVELRSALGPAAAFSVAAGAVSLRLPVSHLPAGIYTAILYFDDGQFTAVPFQKI